MSLIEATLDDLARQGFQVVVLLTGHYPQEQVDMVHRLAREAQQRHLHVRFIGLTEPEVTTAEPGDPAAGDHAAKYETSLALALNPEWVRLDRLTAGRNPTQVTLPDTPLKDAPTHDPTHATYAIHGQDPRTKASKELGEKLLTESCPGWRTKWKRRCVRPALTRIHRCPADQLRWKPVSGDAGVVEPVPKALAGRSSPFDRGGAFRMPRRLRRATRRLRK